MAVRLWDLPAAKEIRQFNWRINKCLGNTALTPDGSWMVSGSGDDVLPIWDVATGKEIRESVGRLSRTAKHWSSDWA